MILWIDAHLSPTLAPWIAENLHVESRPVRDLGLLGATDGAIFMAARKAGAVVMSKDKDFADLVNRLGHHRRFSGSPAATRRTLGSR